MLFFYKVMDEPSFEEHFKDRKSSPKQLFTVVVFSILSLLENVQEESVEILSNC